jgi:fructose-bisphosphate aldolase/6-deoxy-5-ketofructose 1-phosphate synthase
LSAQLQTLEDVVEFRDRSGLHIAGVGYTVYLGSEYEQVMLGEAGHLVYRAHQHGLLSVLWMYPRGRSVKNEKDAHLIAGGAGVASALGSDFVKINPPMQEDVASPELLQEATRAAGRTGVICSGGPSVDVRSFLSRLHDQIHMGGTSGNATGRNIHQKSLDEGIRMCGALSAITVDAADVDEAYRIYLGRSVNQA